MNHAEIEEWTLRVVDRVLAGDQIEDDRVELKSDLIDKNKAARRIAGHLNAARGANVLWILGVDENAMTAPGLSVDADVTSWLQGVLNYFDQVPPDVQTVVVHNGNSPSVTSLLFSGDHIPMVVRNAAHGNSGAGSVEREVPWREGNSTRSALRSDLIRLLVPVARAPAVELISASVEARKYATESPPESHVNKTGFYLAIHVQFYLEVLGRQPFEIPEHRCVAWLESNEGVLVGETNQLSLYPAGIPFRYAGSSKPDVARTIEQGAKQLLVNASGLVGVHASVDIGFNPHDIPDDLHVEVRLSPVGFESELAISALLGTRAPDGETGLPTWGAGTRIW
jgi:hypothetical protein